MSASSTASITGIKFAGLEDGIIAFVSNGYVPIKYLVNGIEVDVQDYSDVTFTSTNPGVAYFASPHNNLLICKTKGKTILMATVKNSTTGAVYTATVPFTVIPRIL